MSYLPMGDIASSEFNATKYPGIAKPSTTTALAVFKNMQSQLNRAGSIVGAKAIAVDGDIGPGTVGLYAAVKSSLALMSLADAGKIAAASTAAEIAMIADVIARVAKSFADSRGVATKVAGPAPVKPPTLVNASGQEFAAPPPDFFASTFGRPLSSTEKIVVVGMAAGIGYMVWKKTASKGRRRR